LNIKVLQLELKVFRFSIFLTMPFALKNPYANAAAKGEKRAGESIEDPSTPKKAKKAPSAASLVRSVGFHAA
jgi:hypothetical protein